MEFAFTEEQLMIRDTAAAFLAEVSDSAAVRRAMATELGYEEAVWRRVYEEMYWQALHIPERCGGLGLGYVELAAIMEQMGRYLFCSPFFATVCLGANALLVAGSASQQDEWLPKIAAGELTATLACGDGAGAGSVSATFRREGDHYRLDGECRYVVDGHSAGLLVVAAREAGSVGESGIGLFIVPAGSAGLHCERLPTMDQTRRQAILRLQGVAVPAAAVLGAPGNSWPQLARVLDLAAVALAAEQVGASQQLLDTTVAYTRERVQFNRPVASFQAVKHKAADMMLQTEVARSGVYYAACVAQECLQGGAMAAELPEAASVARSYASDACFAVAGDALQLHGGVGFTWEYDVHLYFKRAKASGQMLGTSALHRERLAALLLD